MRCSPPRSRRRAWACRRARRSARDTVSEREQLAVIHDRHAIAEPRGLLHVVRRVDDGRALRRAAPRCCRRSSCATAGRRRRSARRAAAARGSCTQRRREVEPPLHAAGVGLRRGRAAVGEADELERPSHAFGERAAARARTGGRRTSRFSSPVSSLVERQRLRRDADARAHGGRVGGRAPASATAPRRARAGRRRGRPSCSCRRRSGRAGRRSRRGRTSSERSSTATWAP